MQSRSLETGRAAVHQRYEIIRTGPDVPVGQTSVTARSDGAVRGVGEVSEAEHLGPHSDLYRELLEREKRLEALITQLLVRQGLEDVRLEQATTREPTVPLSAREVEILRWLVAGRTNRQIGAELELGAGTVRNYLGRIFRKLGVSTRTQAALLAVELGLVSFGDVSARNGTSDDAEGQAVKDIDGYRAPP